MHRTFSLILFLWATLAMAQNPFAGTRWGAYMTGPGGGYVMVDFDFHADTVFMISAISNVSLPFAKYVVEEDLVTFHAIPNFPCVNDPDTFSFTIVVDSLDFAPHSVSCQSNSATWSPYRFIRVSGVGIDEAPQAMPLGAWPNPANEVLFIQRPHGVVPGSVITVHSSMGTEVARQTVQQDVQAIPVGQLAPGLYHVRAAGEGGTYRQQVVVAR